MATGPIGFFGKVPSKGDFVTSNLPAGFTQPWDGWLRLTLAHCNERLGERSRAAFLSSPVWRFILGPGCCGSQAWTGVIASSVDRIGRLYPLTLATGLDGNEYPISLMAGWEEGFERLIDLALGMLRDESMLDRATAVLQQIIAECPPPASTGSMPPMRKVEGALGPGDAVSIAYLPAETEFASACVAAVPRAGAQFSLMWQIGWGLPPLAVIANGLPDTSRTSTIWEASPQAPQIR